MDMKRTSGQRALILAVTAASFAALVAGLAVTGAAAAPIPWVDVSGTPLAAAPVHAQRACTAADLQIVAGRNGAFQGWAVQELLVTNRAPDACALAGPLTGAALLDAGGRRALTAAASAAHRLDLAPGQTARMLVGTPGVCAGAGHPAVASSLQVVLASGESSTVPGVWVNVECGSPRTILFRAGPAPATATVPASRLRATLKAPSSAVRGAPFTYVVILSNPTAGPIALGACPSYTEWLGAAPSSVVRRTLRLNCGAAPSLAPGQSLAFEMRLDVPSTMTPGLTKLSWVLEVPEGAAVGTAVGVS